MNPRVNTIKQLVGDGLYTVEPAAVADAIVLRALARRSLPEVGFRSAPEQRPLVRSFRPDRYARSFRLSRSRLRRSRAQPACRPSRSS